MDGIPRSRVAAPLGLGERLVGIDRGSDVRAGIRRYLNLRKVNRFDDIPGVSCFLDHWISFC